MKPSDKFLDLLNDSVSKTEFIEAFSDVVKTVKKFEAKTEADIRALVQTITQLQAKLDSDTSVTLEEMKAYVKTLQHGKDGKDGERGADGLDADEDAIVAQVLARIVMPETREPIMDTKEEIRSKLEALEGDERLNKEAIKGIELLEEAIRELKERPTGRFGGSKGFQLLVDGTKKLLTAQTLNIVPGSGVSIAYAYANGRNDVTISAAGGNIAVLAATGDIDGVNATYTFASAPVIVIVNGASYRNGSGVTITGTSAVLDFAPQTSSDVYGLG